jgi:hypothetical protein
MKHLLIILTALTMIACSPKARFNRLIEKHPELLVADTILIRDTITLYIPEVHTDTVVTLRELIDTVTLTKERVTVKAWYIPKEKKVYIQGKCDPVYVTKIIDRKIPIKYYEKYPWWKKLANNMLAILIIFAIVYTSYKLYRKLV